MISLISSGIRISVETAYQSDISEPSENQFIFAYRITIENKNEFPVQLLRRHWDIVDSNGLHREVDGEGVIGDQPFIEPGGKYEYTSACHLQTDLGLMKGFYMMQNTFTQQQFNCTIPAFVMAPFYRLN